MARLGTRSEFTNFPGASACAISFAAKSTGDVSPVSQANISIENFNHQTEANKQDER